MSGDDLHCRKHTKRFYRRIDTLTASRAQPLFLRVRQCTIQLKINDLLAYNAHQASKRVLGAYPWSVMVQFNLFKNDSSVYI